MDKKKQINPSSPIDPRQKAVAVKYDVSDIAPRVVAKGRGYIAEKILEKAKDEDVPIYQDAKLAEELTQLDIGENIPPELYEVVAQVLVFISDLDRREGLLQNAQ